MSLAAAGCAFYATLALFPAISMLVSVYGLVFDPVSVEPQLQVLSGLLPPPAFALINDRVHELVSQSNGNLSLGLLVSFLLTFWSSSTGTKSVLSAINVAYDVTEQRPFVLLFLPVLITAVGLSSHSAGLIHIASLLMLVGFFTVAIGLLYRFGPSREPPPDPRIKPGAIFATLLWLIASELLSFYVSRIGSFGATYGSLGAGVGVMLWFYISAYAVLLGAELNACLEEQAHQLLAVRSPAC
jgi:membrane protein